MLSLATSRALQSTRLLVDMSTPSWMKGTSFQFCVGVFMFLFAMLYLYCLVKLIISTFTELFEQIKMTHRHRLSDDVTPTTSSKKDATTTTTTTDADDEDTSADYDIATVDTTVEDFVDCEYTHQRWMNELLLNYFEHSILLHQMFIQWYTAEFIEVTLGYVSILCELDTIISSCTLSNLLLFTSSIAIIQLHRRLIRNQG